MSTKGLICSDSNLWSECAQLWIKIGYKST